MPVRKSSRQGGRAIGRFPSLKMGRMIAFESLLERDFICLLDFDTSIKWFDKKPLIIEIMHEGKQVLQKPDFHLIEREQQMLGECKQESFIETDENLRLYATAQDLCYGHVSEFRPTADKQMHALRSHNFTKRIIMSLHC
jgi:hypothetical protein